MRIRDRVVLIAVLAGCVLVASVTLGFVPGSAEKARAGQAQPCQEFCQTSTQPPSIPTSVSLSPDSANASVSDEHTVVATVLDQFEHPMPNTKVDFQVTGANPTSGEATTFNGEAIFTYTGINEGIDQIFAFVDRDNDGVHEPDPPNNEPSDTATAEWFPPLPECDDHPEAICGTNGPDVLTGTEGDDLIIAGAGDDVIAGLGGNDTIFAGEDDDSVDGGAGNDTIYGDLNSEPGTEQQLFGANQTFDKSGRDELLGGLGNDLIFGGGGKDDIGGGAGDDIASGQGARDRLEGGKGRDIVHGDAGDDDVFGNSDDDKVWGDGGDDLLFGGDGDDDLYGLGGIDSCIQGDGTGIAKRCESLTKRHR